MSSKLTASETVDLLTFFNAMQAKLESRADEKGGWQDEELDYFVDRLADELAELQAAVEEATVASYANRITAKHWARVMEEAADISNFAMMVHAQARREADWNVCAEDDNDE